MDRKEKLISIKEVVTKYTETNLIKVDTPEMEQLTKWIMELCIRVYDKGFEDGKRDLINFLDA